jgi:hypothetical protein
VEQAPGGPLEVQVYAGADATFELKEDDGTTKAYAIDDRRFTSAGGASAVRTTSFTWTDRTQTLSWVVRGSFKDEATFVSMTIALFTPGATAALRTEIFAIGPSGTRSFQK